MKSAGISIKPYRRSDKAPIMGLLSSLDRKYPLGGDWLAARMDQVEGGKAFADVIRDRGLVCAVALTTPKGQRRVKLSTFLVHPLVRSRGAGTALLAALARRWQRQALDEVIVTVDVCDVSTAAFFRKHRFKMLASERVRYGENRWDHVMRWTPDDAAHSASFPEV
jgi:N-acetylglutamate synthase-like GNAT family acetyltransferase